MNAERALLAHNFERERSGFLCEGLTVLLPALEVADPGGVTQRLGRVLEWAPVSAFTQAVMKGEICLDVSFPIVAEVADARNSCCANAQQRGTSAQLAGRVNVVKAVDLLTVLFGDVREMPVAKAHPPRLTGMVRVSHHESDMTNLGLCVRVTPELEKVFIGGRADDHADPLVWLQETIGDLFVYAEVCEIPDSLDCLIAVPDPEVARRILLTLTQELPGLHAWLIFTPFDRVNRISLNRFQELRHGDRPVALRVATKHPVGEKLRVYEPGIAQLHSGESYTGRTERIGDDLAFVAHETDSDQAKVRQEGFVMPRVLKNLLSGV
jgi:hypothetical protein